MHTRTLLAPSLALLALTQCNRGSAVAPSPVARPQLVPEATRVGPAPTAPVVPSVPVAPPTPADGPCTVDTAAARELSAGRGEVRQMQLRAGPTDARLSADVFAARALTSYQWALGAAPAEPVVLERFDPRLHGRSGAVVQGGGWTSVQYRAALRGLGENPNSDNQESLGTYPRTGGMVGVRVTQGATSSEGQLPYDPDEFVATAEADRVFFAGAGATLACSMIGQCWREGYRGTSATGYDSKNGYAVFFGTFEAGQARAVSVQHADCERQYPRSDGESDEWVSEESGLGDSTGSMRYFCTTAARDRADAVALASHATHPAVLWRTRAGLFYALPPTHLTGNESVSAWPLATGMVGAPAAVWDGDNLVAVWAQRTDARSPWNLRYARWPARNSGPMPESTPLATSPASAFAPTLQLAAGRTVLTWMEGDANHGVIRVGSSYRGIAHATDNALTVTANTPNARDPEVALGSNGTGWLAWVEYPVGRLQNGLVRAAPLRCP